MTSFLQLILVYVFCVLLDSGRSLCGVFFFFQAEDGIRYLVRSRGLGDVYKRQGPMSNPPTERTICIDVGGQSLPAVCKVPASRLDKLSLIHI